MVRITVDNELRKKLLDFTEDVEICDDTGEVLARVQRIMPWMVPDEEWEPLTPEISPEEIQRRLKEGGPTFTTEEVLEQLRKL